MLSLIGFLKPESIMVAVKPAKYVLIVLKLSVLIPANQVIHKAMEDIEGGNSCLVESDYY